LEELNNMEEGGPDNFLGYLYKGKLYYGDKKPTIMGDYVIWPQAMGPCIIDTGTSIEGIFRCALLPGGKIDIHSPFERIK